MTIDGNSRLGRRVMLMLWLQAVCEQYAEAWLDGVELRAAVAVWN